MRILNLIITSAIAIGYVSAKPQPVKTLPIGSAAPPFNLPGVDSKNHQLTDFSDAKVLVVVFTCNHCPDARAARGKVISLHRDYKDKGVAVVAISGNDDKALRLDEIGYSVYGDSLEDMKNVAREEGYTFPYLYDGETQTVTKAYGAVATPHVFVFDSERKLRYTGRIDDARRSKKNMGKAYVREAIEALLQGIEVPTKTTRPFGCSTKWSWKRESVAKDNAKWKSLPVTLDNLTLASVKQLAANKTGKLRLVNFWSTACGPCVAEFPDLIDTYRRFQNRPFELITVSVDPVDDRKQVQKFLSGHHAALSPRTVGSLKEENRTSNNYLFTGTNLDHLADAFDAKWNGALPHTVVIAPGGNVIWRHTGRVNVVELRRAIVSHFDAMRNK
ncbi:MAG: redoxin domain-containing protein [Verrucomicrobiae bacterium]|nr:redoxin domain-containing protein [Verrucomicrobiae bacterium]NNJ86407.1 redoxin domain-containing protein [Akkermansiaceae bacterium]